MRSGRPRLRFPRALAGCAAIAAALLCACNKPHLRNFFAPGAQVYRAFGQLYDDAGTPKVSHYAIVRVPALPGIHLRAIASGTIQYVANLDGMGNCLLLRPELHLTTPNDFSGLRALPAPGALVLVYGHLDEATVRSAARDIYQAKHAGAPAGELDDAADHFIAGDDGFQTLEVTAHESDPAQSAVLGDAIANDLYLATFTEDNGVRTYVNPMPYLTKVLAPGTTDSIPPVIDDVVIETSASGTFGADRVTQVIAGDTIADPVPREFLRVAVRSTDTYHLTTDLIVPYRIVTTLTRTTGAAEVKARGEALLNSFQLANAAAIAAAAYGSSGPVASNIGTHQFYMFAGWHPDLPPPVPEEAAFNSLSSPGPFTLDLKRMAGVSRAFPPGSYELEIKVEDLAHAAGAAATKKIHFTLGGAPLVEILADSNNDHAVGAGDAVLPALHIARWDNAYGPGPGFAVANAAHPAHFIEQDPSRFYIRVTDLAADTDSTTVQQVKAKIGTIDATAATRDDLTDITLIETAANSGVFVSESQMLTIPPPTVDPIDEDDAFQAHSDRSGGAVADDAADDRTHRATIDDSVRVVYPAAGGPDVQTVDVPVSTRAPEERRKAEIRVIVFMEPFDDVGFDQDGVPATPPVGAGNSTFDFNDTNGNGRHDAGEACEPFTDVSTSKTAPGVTGSRGSVVDQALVDAHVERANLSWAQASIRVVSLGTVFTDAPNHLVTGVNILRDGVFDFGPNKDDRAIIAAHAAAATIDVVTVFFVGDSTDVNGLARTPSDLIAALGEKTFLFVIPSVDVHNRTLAHELGHGFDNGFDSVNPDPIFYPATPSSKDDKINRRRRITQTTMNNCRAVRPAGNMTATGNRILKLP